MIIIDSNHIRYNRGLFTVNDFFLTSEVKLNASINYFIQVPENVSGQLNDFYTLLIDLEVPQEIIWQNIYHRTRSEINSFLNNQSYDYKVTTNLTSENLKKYIHLFDVFAKSKKIRKAEVFRLNAYNKNGLLAVTEICIDNQLVHVNIYRVNKQRATNLYSFPVKNNCRLNSTQKGRLHRAIHWLDIISFKTQQIKYYDFCGWYEGKEDKTLLNVNKFKEQFTNYKVKEYSGVVYTSKFLLFLLKFIR